MAILIFLLFLDAQCQVDLQHFCAINRASALSIIRVFCHVQQQTITINCRDLLFLRVHSV